MEECMKLRHGDDAVRWRRRERRRGGRGRAKNVAGGLAPILVVDDDSDCCLALVRTLRREGYRAEWTTDPVLALGRVLDRGFALVVSDVNLPRMLGTELAGEIGAIRPGLPVMLVSGFTSPMLRHYAHARGLALLSKPFSVSEFLAGVEALVGRSDGEGHGSGMVSTAEPG